MKLQVLFFIALAAVVAAADEEVASTTAETTSATPEQTECCYPRPPPRKDRGFKKHASRCCEFPVAEIYEKFQTDLEACKAENQNQKHHDHDSSSTTTSTTPSPETADPEIPEKDNDFDAEMPESMEDNETEPTEAATESSSPSSAPVVHPTGRHHGPHKGKGKGHKHRGGCGKCLKAAMEKQGWSNNGTINWDAILEATSKASTKAAEEWLPIVKEAINECSKKAAVIPPTATTPVPEQKEKDEKRRGRGAPTPEKQAWRCVVNNSIMKCPNFPEDNEYCVKLREAHKKCSAEVTGFGPHQFRWCEKPNGRGKKPHHSHHHKH